VAGRSRQVRCRIYIVYHHALFAQGIRSLLRGRPAMRVIGMESDINKAVQEVGSLRPEVIIVEESDVGVQSPTLGAILERHPTGRVVTLDLDHNFATVYDRHRVITAQPADLVKAIRGEFRDRGNPRPEPAPHASRQRGTQGETPPVPLSEVDRKR